MKDLSPGSELDEIIAHKIMGYYYGGPFDGLFFDPNGKSISREELPPYSSKISSAWLVVEHLKDSKEGFGFELRLDPYDIWIASFADGKFIGESGSAPHAICLAALKTIGYE